MKLRRVQFDRYVGDEQKRQFTSAHFDIEFDGDHLITITATTDVGRAILPAPVMVCAHNADMYPEPIEQPQPARALPAKPRSK